MIITLCRASEPSFKTGLISVEQMLLLFGRQKKTNITETNPNSVQVMNPSE
jgi:hypothetical protein